MAASHNTRLLELLDRWEESAERGEELDLAELCADTPELLEELTRQVTALKAMDRRFNVHQGQTAPASDFQDGSVTEDSALAATKRNAAYETVSSYHQLVRLAQGGLGIVHRAKDAQLHREVVLKFIHRHIAQSDEHQAMLRREAEITSRLDHPGVVPVYGIGQSSDGRIFYVMRYIQGETLDEAIERLHDGETETTAAEGLALRNLLGRFVTICKTVAYAHNRGIIHRDIKPANIMLGRYGETLVVDWGLATAVGRDERFKQSGEQTLLPSDSQGDGGDNSGAGTPAFMSPEAASNRGTLTPATDIYSLGATLYKVLTGKAAFEAKSLPLFCEKVIRGDFASPSKAKRGVPKALEGICLKAMANDPPRRYATALELAEDIENFLADEPVTAYHEPLPRRVARWARRHRSLALSGLVGIAALGLVTAISAVWLGYLARSEHEARVAAESAKHDSLRMAAMFAARTIAGQIDLRWRILESSGKDPALKEALVTINSISPDDTSRWQAEQKSLQNWLNEQYIQLQDDDAIQFNSLFLLDLQGIQVARAPISNSIGKSFAHRDYFHGHGHKLPEGESLQPIQTVNLSATYASSTSGKLKVAFTIPVVSGMPGQQRIVGVFGMSVELGGFGLLDTDLQSGQIVVLVDSRQDAIDKGDLRSGLILQHPALTQTDPSQQAARMDAKDLDHIDWTAETPLLREYHDPLAEGTWLTSFRRVIVQGREPPIRDTGWIVLAQERE